MPASKIGLAIIAVFLLVFGVYLISNDKTISGSFDSDSGWIYNTVSGYFVLGLGIGSVALLIYIIKGKKL